MDNIILYSLLGFISLILVIIALSKTKIPSFDDFKKRINSNNKSILSAIFDIIGNVFAFIFSPIMLLMIVFLICGTTTIKTCMIGGETQCGKIVEKTLETRTNADKDDLEEEEFDIYYICKIYFLDDNYETHSATIKYNLYLEYLKNPDKTYCVVIYSSEFYLYLISSIFLLIFCIGIIIYINI